MPGRKASGIHAGAFLKLPSMAICPSGMSCDGGFYASRQFVHETPSPSPPARHTGEKDEDILTRSVQRRRPWKSPLAAKGTEAPVMTSHARHTGKKNKDIAPCSAKLINILTQEPGRRMVCPSLKARPRTRQNDVHRGSNRQDVDLRKAPAWMPDAFRPDNITMLPIVLIGFWPQRPRGKTMRRPQGSVA